MILQIPEFIMAEKVFTYFEGHQREMLREVCRLWNYYIIDIMYKQQYPREHRISFEQYRDNMDVRNIKKGSPRTLVFLFEEPMPREYWQMSSFWMYNPVSMQLHYDDDTEFVHETMRTFNWLDGVQSLLYTPTEKNNLPALLDQLPNLKRLTLFCDSPGFNQSPKGYRYHLTEILKHITPNHLSDSRCFVDNSTIIADDTTLESLILSSHKEPIKYLSFCKKGTNITVNGMMNFLTKAKFDPDHPVAIYFGSIAGSIEELMTWKAPDEEPQSWVFTRKCNTVFRIYPEGRHSRHIYVNIGNLEDSDEATDLYEFTGDEIILNHADNVDMTELISEIQSDNLRL